MSPSSSQPQLPSAPNAPPPPPLFGMQQGNKKPKAKGMQTSFLGEGAEANPTNTGQKTLLGA